MNPESCAPTAPRKRPARERSAHASLRGYLYQVCLGVQRWIALDDGEVLVCEGDEDLDRRLLGTGGGTFEQVKDYRGRRLGLGDTVVIESLQHFLRGYVDLKRQARPGRYVFTTTAEPSRRRDGLDFDLLQKWRDGDRSKKTCKEVRKLLAGKGTPKGTAEPAAWLDSEAEGWKGFLDAVEWTFGAPDLDAIRREIGEQIGRHDTLRLLPREDILERLVGEVLNRSSRPKPAERTLTRTDLAKLAESAQADLAKWVQTDGLALRRMFEEVEKLDGLLTDHTSELQQNPSPGQLLTASYEVIPFREAGREGELKALAAWCNGEDRRSVLLLTGEGGAGKTRLGIEWCRRLRHQGWHAGFLQWECEPADLPALLEGEAPRLIVLDYAETRLSVLTPLLYKLAIGRRTGPKVRLLLLSRQAGDWWEALREGRERAEIRDVLGSSQTREITPLVSGEEERRSAFRAAEEGFALARGQKLPRHLPEPPFEHPDFERALYLHMAALAALEGKTIGSADEARAETLVHEQRFWKEQVKEMRLDAGLAGWMEPALAQAVATLTLTGGAEKSRARALLGQVLAPPAGRTDLIDHAARFLLRLYRRQHDQAPALEPLQPDLLGEELVEQQLKLDADLLDRVLDRATIQEAQNALTVLTRLARRRPEPAATWLAAAFRGERLEQLAEPALEVAIETGDPVGMVLAREVEERASEELARRLMRRCGEDRYRRSVHLREVALASHQRCYALLPEPGSPQKDDSALVKRAGLANNLGNRLSDLGRHEAALAATAEAAEHFRSLSATYSDAVLPVLATSLNNLGKMLSDLGRREEALAATQEAVALCRLLSATRSDAVLPKLAISLHNLGKMLSDLGRREEALKAAQEAVEHYRSLSATRSDAFLPDLARSLNNLGSMLSALGRREQALTATQEAVAHYRSLSGTRPDAFLPDLAWSLHNLGKMLGDLDRREEALAATEAVVALRRSLSATRPDAFLPDLASSLHNLGLWLSALGRLEEALAAAEEAVRILAPYFSRYPAAFREWMSIFARNYLLHSEAAGREPDRELLAPLEGPLGLSLDPPAEAAPESPEA